MNFRVFRLLPLLIAAGCGGDDALYEPPAELVDIEATVELERLWSERVGKSREGLRLALQPATDGARIFAGTYDGRVVALSAETGNEVWSIETELALSAGPSYAAGRLVFGTVDGQVVLLDADDGSELWRADSGSEVLAPPALDASRVIVRTTDGRLRSFSVATGQRQWVALQSVPALAMRGDAPPLIAGQLVISGFENGRLAAYSLADGSQVWDVPIASTAGTNELERLVDVAVDMRVVGNDIYTVTYHGRAARVDLRTGDGIWQFDVSSYAGLGLDVNTVYVTDEFGAIIALSRRDGAELWRQEQLRLRDVTAATRLGSLLVVGDFEGYLHGLDPSTGELVARERAASTRITSAPLVVGQRLFVQSDSGTLAAYALPQDDEDDEDSGD